MWKISSVLRHLDHWITFGQAPDPDAIRKRDGLLRDRAELAPEEWCTVYCELDSVDPSVVKFVFRFFEEFLHIRAGRLRPQDRLREDLQLGKGTWSDWEFDFGEQFEEQFGCSFTKQRPFPSSATVLDFLRDLTAFCQPSG